jgi:glycosyltransferase involved in cell wall biosynthesis
MHIAMYTPAWPADKYSNGIVTYVQHVRTELLRQGHRVSLLTGSIDDEDLGPDIHRVDKRGALGDRILRKLGLVDKPQSWGHMLGRRILDIHRSAPIDVVEVEESFGWCKDLSDMVPMPVIVKLHGPAFLDMVEGRDTPQGEKKMADEGVALRASRFITSPSSDTLAQTLAHYDLKPLIGETVPNPMVAASDAHQWRLDRCDPKALLFIGRFDLRKGGDIVLRAFHRLLQTRPDLKLVFAGPDRGVPDASGRKVHLPEFVDSLFTPAQKAQVSYLGQTPVSQIPGLRQQALVTLVASRWDNQPNTALEAMMQSCPVVAIDAGGVGEIVQHGETGLLARHDDLDDFCRQIETLLDDPSAAAELGRRGRIAITQRHDVRTLVGDTLSVYQRAIAQTKTR